MKERDNQIKQANKYSQPKSTGKKIFHISLILVIILLVYIIVQLFTSHQACDSWECFNQNLIDCKKTTFAGGQEFIFGYTINGKTDNTCEVQVEYLQGNLANKKATQLKNKKMTCNIPTGIAILPEKQIEYCTGPLKEALQNQIITQLHNYIIQNVGQINKDILNPLQI
ncbi:MAG: hypothetical protein ACI83O_000300 [Patescibacteria group bacterium]|jgi:hypothetical protein